ncbi:MAG: hypothetical protein HGB22_04305 [Chlorobiaceae bacterium]|nr:hypothetical protein [Chlorobiaceae bacterium]
MLILLAALAVVFSCSTAQAREYGSYDPKRILSVSESPSGTRYGIDLQYLDQIINDLSTHAKNYPPHFDTPQDRQRAVQNIAMLSGMLDLMVNDPNPSQEILLRAGDLNSMGHNLDIAGSAQRAGASFQKLLAIAPEHPFGNYLYGKFLAETGNPSQALPYLEKAHTFGVVYADYTLGMIYLTLGDKQKCLEHLEAYRQARPDDGKVSFLIDGIRNGKIQLKTSGL